MNNKHYIIPIFVPHEGCPHNCVFCNQNTITGSSSKVDGKYVENVAEEYLKTMDLENSIVEMSFFGGTFTAINIEKQKELLTVAKGYKDRGLISKIRLSTRPDYIDDYILENLKKYDVDIIELGVQSLDDDVLIKAGRGHSANQVIKASYLIKKYGFTLGHQIMPGLPGDDFNKDIETVKKVISLKPDMCRIYPSLIIKNTPMETMYLNNQYKPYTLEEAVEICKVIYGMLTVNGIKVIRIGLQPTEEINWGKELVNGPFHPAFRELVEGSIYNDMLGSFIYELQVEDEITVEINSKDISKLYAQGKKYFNAMKQQFGKQNIIIVQNNGLDIGSLAISYNGKCCKKSIERFLSIKYKEGYI